MTDETCEAGRFFDENRDRLHRFVEDHEVIENMAAQHTEIYDALFKGDKHSTDERPLIAKLKFMVEDNARATYMRKKFHKWFFGVTAIIMTLAGVIGVLTGWFSNILLVLGGT